MKPADGPQRTIVVAFHHDLGTGIAARDNWTILTTKPGEVVTSVTGQDNRVTAAMTIDGVATSRSYQFNPDPAGARWIEV